MSKIVANYNGGASDEYGTFAAINRLLTGDVIEGFQVVPNATPNMTVKVNTGSGRVSTGTYPSNYGYFINHDTVGGESVTIATAAASPRIDYVVGYVDKGVTAAVSPVNNTNNLLKFAAVAGTPAGSPVVPTVAQIQTAIGAANPYSIYAQIAVAASVTTITIPNITDMRVMAGITAPNIGFATLLPSLFTAFGTNVQTQTNTGNIGGSISYLNLGGVKLLWMDSANINIAASTVYSGYTISFPASFFSASPKAIVNVSVADNNLVSARGFSKSASTMVMTLQNTSGSVANVNVTIIAIGV